MKKTMMVLLGMGLILSGCALSSDTSDDTSVMLGTTQDGETVYTLYDEDGNAVTTTTITDYTEVSGAGYIVEDDDDNVSAISSTGETLIKSGEYKYIYGKSGLFMATNAAASSMSFNKTSLTLTEEDTTTLKVTGADNDDVVFASSDESVATISKKGKVTAMSAGTATLTAVSGTLTATCKVTVKALEPKLSETELELEVEDTKKLKVTGAGHRTVKWSSSDTSIVKVSKKGKLTAVAEGEATITVKAGDDELTCKVTVKEPTVSINKKKKTILTDDTLQLKLKNVRDGQTITWSSSDESVATVSRKGMVTGLKAGTATITAEVMGQTLTCKVTVKKRSLSMNKSKASMETEGTLKLKVKNKKKGSKVTWSSSDKSVATVSKKGKVTAKKAGTVTITATVGKSKTKVTCEITVTKRTVRMNKTEATITVGKTLKLKVKNKKSPKTIKWSSSNKKVATVSSGGKVTAKKAGYATITAKWGKKKVTCKITVKAKTLKLNQTEASLYVGKSTTLKVKNKTKKQTVTWSSSDTSIATVSEKGKVKGKKAGTATITAKVGDTELTCEVTVSKRTLKLNKSSLTLTEDDTAKLKVKYKEDDETVKWSSSDKSIVTVSGKGKVTAVSEGTATITAKIGKSLKATCEVTVEDRVVTLEEDEFTLTVDDTAKIKVKNAGERTVTYSSQNAAVAKVSKKGKITAVSAGDAKITVKVGTDKLTVNVTVNAKKVSLNKKKATLVKGDTLRLKLKNANSTPIYASDDENIATVSSKGKVTAKATGVAHITAVDGDNSYTCTITVTRDDDKITHTKSVPMTSADVTVIDSTGSTLYEASEDTRIKISDLPIIVQDGTYKVLYDKDTTLYDGDEEVHYVRVSDDGSVVAIAFADHIQVYFTNQSTEDDLDLEVVGNFDIAAYDTRYLVMYDEDNGAVAYFDRESGETYFLDMTITGATIDNDIVVLHDEDNTYLVNAGKIVTVNSYWKDATHYIKRNENVLSGPHTVVNGDDTATLENVELYPGSQYLCADLYPVYVEDTGYMYYNLEGEEAFDEVYATAGAYDANERAVVSYDDGSYSLIDVSGLELISDSAGITALGSDWYAVYVESGAFYLYDKEGDKVSDDEYTGLTDNPVVEVDGVTYLTLIKNGRTYVYNMDKDMKDVFSSEGDVSVSADGYILVDGTTYYTMSGEKME